MEYTESIEAWHFLREDKRLGYEDGRLVKEGETLSIDGPLILCKRGMHGSIRAIDALTYAPGPVLCKVLIHGTKEHPILRDSDKLVGVARTCVAMRDVTVTLHEFACDVAEEALGLINKPDPRSLKAIETKRRWLKGKATDGELAAARAAARAEDWAAAWAAAKDAALDAAKDAARAAVRVAAWDAAKDAARAAVRVAAWAAARAAASGAAWAAAKDAAWAAQNERLERMVALFTT